MKYSNALTGLLMAAPCMAQLYQGNFNIPITGDPSSGVQVMNRIAVSETAGLDGPTFSVNTSLAFSGEDGRFLRLNSSRVAFDPATEIGPGTMVHVDPMTQDASRVRLVSYFWRVEYPGNRLSAEFFRDSFANQSSILIGFTRLSQGAWQYGWVHMEREVTRFEDMLLPDGSTRDFAFRPKGFAIHPIPGRPIRAGMEPDLPSLSTELVALGGDGGQGIRVSWPTGWPGMVLEYASELKQPTEWLPVAGVEGSQAVVKLPEDGHVFFRLRYAP